MAAAQAAGRLVDLAIGPAQPEGPIARLYLLLSVLLLLATCAHRVVIAAVGASCAALPLAGGAVDTGAIATRALDATAGPFAAALALAAPVLLAISLPPAPRAGSSRRDGR